MFSTSSISVIRHTREATAEPPTVSAAAAPPPLVALGNIASLQMMRPAAVVAPRQGNGLMDRIARADKTLCRLMALQRRENVDTKTRDHYAGTDAEAQELIDRIDIPRQALAALSAQELTHWLTPNGMPCVDLDYAVLKQQILHAGLHRILDRLDMNALTLAQRLRIATQLRDLGACAATLRERMALTPEHLRVDYARELLHDLLSDKHAAQLNLRQLHSPDLEDTRAKIFQYASKVSRRFGYTAQRPAWRVLADQGYRYPQIRKLELLAGLPEAKRQGIRVNQLP